MRNPAGRPKGSKQSPEAIEKIRLALAARWRAPVYRESHLPLLARAGKIGNRVVAERYGFRPKPGTPEYNQYEKVRSILGAEAARATL